MKRLYAAIVLIIFSLTACVLSSSYVTKTTEKISLEIQKAAQVIHENDEVNATQELEAAIKSWEEAELRLSFIIDADKIEEISIGISMAKKHLEDNNTEHALERLRECELMLMEMKENERPGIKNIM